jgi:hypothetical protein
MPSNKHRISAAAFKAGKNGKQTNLSPRNPQFDTNTTVAAQLLYATPRKIETLEAKVNEERERTGLNLSHSGTGQIRIGSVGGLLLAVAVLAACVGEAEGKARSKFTRAEVVGVPPVRGTDCVALTLYSADAKGLIPNKVISTCGISFDVQMNSEEMGAEKRHSDVHEGIAEKIGEKRSHKKHTHVVGSATETTCVVGALRKKGLLSKRDAKEAKKAIKSLESQCSKTRYTGVKYDIIFTSKNGECATVTIKGEGLEGTPATGLSGVSENCASVPKISTTKHEIEGLVGHTVSFKGSYAELKCVLGELANSGSISGGHPAVILDRIKGHCVSVQAQKEVARTGL